uniref:guanylate cyclase n=1 Tax=Plectus sambesii TaxID=2011161 RepID=A0A914XIY8_9BILA
MKGFAVDGTVLFSFYDCVDVQVGWITSDLRYAQIESKMKRISSATTMCAVSCLLAQLMLLTSTASAQTSSALKLGFTAGTDFLDFMLPICQLAVDDVRQTAGINKNVPINVIVEDACRPAGDPYHLGVTNTAEMYYSKHIDALIGPPCSPEFLDSARMCAQWQIPVISWWATDPSLGDKNIYSSTVQLSARNQNGFAVAIYTIITRKYSWRNVAFVGSSTLNSPGPNQLLGIKALFDQKNDIKTVGYIEYPGLPSADDIISSPNFAKIKTSARIYIASFGTDLEANTNFVLAVHRANLTEDGFVFIIPWIMRRHNDLPWVINGTTDTEILTAFSKVLIVEPAGNNKQQLYAFSESTMQRAQWSENAYTAVNSSLYALILLAAAYDGCYTYAFGLSRTLDGSSTIVRNSSFSQALIDNLRSTQFEGALGTVYLDKRAERLPSFILRSLSESPGGNPVLVLQANESSCSTDGMICFTMTFQETSFNFFPNGVPLDVPTCGFDGSMCTNYWLVITMVVAAGVVVGLIVIAIFTWKRYKQLEVYKLHWKVTKESMKIIEQNPLMDSLRSLKEASADGVKLKKRFLPVYAIVGTIKAELLDFKQNQHINFTKEDLQYLFGLKQLSHENLTSFMGICYNDGEKFYVLYILVERGTLEDFIYDEDFNFDSTFKSAFVRDIVKGLEYLHKSSAGYHGSFSPKTCLIDGNWVLKLTGFGMTNMLSDLFTKRLISFPEGYYVQLSTLLHMAPEQVRVSSLGKAFPGGSAASDIYSFGMTLFQIMYRTAPFDESSMSTEDILKAITTPGPTPLRPAIPKEIRQNEDLINLLLSCWSEQPSERPPIRRVHQVTSAAFGYLKGNLVDQMISMTEKYAQNLERLVADRTQMLVEAQTQTDRLLYEMLPPSIARQLKAGNTVEPRSFATATVLFCQLAEFSALCSQSSPDQIVKFLNDIFTRFDEVVARFDAYKVETSGETYMVVSGLPQENEGRHVYEIAEVSLQLRTAAVTFVVDHYEGFAVAVRIGFHRGPIAAGVIGMGWPRYCLFGDTVNFASRMQSTSEPNHIQIAQSTATFLLGNEKYLVTERGYVNIKGKGEINTFWLDRRRSNSSTADPSPSSSLQLEGEA